MSETDAETDSESGYEAGDYIKDDGMYELFTHPESKRVLKNLADGMKPNRTDMSDELRDLFVEMGFMFADYDDGLGEDMLTLNQHHELTKILDAPHITRIIDNDAAIAALCVHLRKLYLPFVPMDTLVKLTGYEEDELEEGVELLEKFRMLKPSMLMEGKHSKETTLQDAAELMERVDALVDLFDDDEREMVPISELEQAVGELDSGERDDDIVMAVKEDEFKTRVHQAAENGIESITTTDNLSTLEEGEMGKTLDMSSDLAKQFGRFHTKVLRVVQDIHTYTRD